MLDVQKIKSKKYVSFNRGNRHDGLCHVGCIDRDA